MFVLHVELKVKPGLQQPLEKTYREIFLPAISSQKGFQSAHLLRPVEGGADDYRLTLAFDHQASQQQWVATDIHQQVWPQIESQCVEFSARGHNTV
jgi:heme-degrading monooxygenase HmoA